MKGKHSIIDCFACVLPFAVAPNTSFRTCGGANSRVAMIFRGHLIEKVLYIMYKTERIDKSEKNTGKDTVIKQIIP